MWNFQDTFETRELSFISTFFNLDGLTFHIEIAAVLWLHSSIDATRSHKHISFMIQYVGYNFFSWNTKWVKTVGYCFIARFSVVSLKLFDLLLDLFSLIHVFLEINIVKRTLNCPSMYGNWKRKILIIILLIGILLWKRRNNMFVDLESVIYVRNSLLQEQILMFCLINVTNLPQDADIEINLLWSALKIHKIIYTIQFM